MFGKHKIFSPKDMTEIFRGFEGKWVAFYIKEGQIVVSGSGNTIKETMEKAREKGIGDVTLVKVPQESVGYVL